MMALNNCETALSIAILKSKDLQVQLFDLLLKLTLVVFSFIFYFREKLCFLKNRLKKTANRWKLL